MLITARATSSYYSLVLRSCCHF
uniref:Uncharacterized protein n=1 Tax=Rhizophora mucronata TaxID=61149 RepID=A0A2P2QDF6_RHIMU